MATDYKNMLITDCGIRVETRSATVEVPFWDKQSIKENQSMLHTETGAHFILDQSAECAPVTYRERTCVQYAPSLRRDFE